MKILHLLHFVVFVLSCIKADKAGGVLPTAPELFIKTHFKDVPGKGKVAANKTATQISVIYITYI